MSTAAWAEWGVAPGPSAIDRIREAVAAKVTAEADLAALELRQASATSEVEAATAACAEIRQRVARGTVEPGEMKAATVDLAVAGDVVGILAEAITEARGTLARCQKAVRVTLATEARRQAEEASRVIEAAMDGYMQQRNALDPLLQKARTDATGASAMSDAQLSDFVGVDLAA